MDDRDTEKRSQALIFQYMLTRPSQRPVLNAVYQPPFSSSRAAVAGGGSTDSPMLPTTCAPDVQDAPMDLSRTGPHVSPVGLDNFENQRGIIHHRAPERIHNPEEQQGLSTLINPAKADRGDLVATESIRPYKLDEIRLRARQLADRYKAARGHGYSNEEIGSMMNQTSINAPIGAQSKGIDVQSSGMDVQLNTFGSSSSPSRSPNTLSPPQAATESSYSPMEEEDSNQNSSSISTSGNELQAPIIGSKVCKKRARSTVPDELKNEAYMVKRKKNNESAKRSRDNKRNMEDHVAKGVVFFRGDNMKLMMKMESLGNAIAAIREC